MNIHPKLPNTKFFKIEISSDPENLGFWGHIMKKLIFPSAVAGVNHKIILMLVIGITNIPQYMAH